MTEFLKNFVSVNEFEESALSILPQNARDYYKSGACAEYSLNLNRTAFHRLRIKPRFLIDVSKCVTETQALGTTVSMPIGVSPTAMQKLAHPDGELANARAVGEMGSIFVLSTLATSSIEEVAAAAPNTIKWYQLYIYKNREITKKLIQRAERAGYRALVLTVDAPVIGNRYADARNRFVLPGNLKLANFEELGSTEIGQQKDDSWLMKYSQELFDASINWRDVEWIQTVTSLPVILKGVLTAEDAEIAVNLGVAGIVVSNHGGRQLDTCPAPIEVLPEIVKAVGKRCEVYLDGGIRYGTDVFKAIALGAKMVFVGRPAVWGLTCGGQKGVERVLQILKDEFHNAMVLSGCPTIRDIKKEMIVHESTFAHL